jgi:hypothetical protein
MLFEISGYPDVPSFNQDGRRRNAMIEAQQPGWSSDRYWRVEQVIPQADGGLLVVWSRKTTAV